MNAFAGSGWVGKLLTFKLQLHDFFLKELCYTKDSLQGGLETNVTFSMSSLQKISRAKQDLEN